MNKTKAEKDIEDVEFVLGELVRFILYQQSSHEICMLNSVPSHANGFGDGTARVGAKV